MVMTFFGHIQLFNSMVCSFNPKPKRPMLIKMLIKKLYCTIIGTIWQTGGFVSAYDVFPLTTEGRAALKPGKNLLAIHCHQTTGGQYVDLGFVRVQNN